MNPEGVFRFEADGEAQEFCEDIARVMMESFNISRFEAVDRINRRWSGFDFKSEDVRFHETADFWAQDIYLGSDSGWWLEHDPDTSDPL